VTSPILVSNLPLRGRWPRILISTTLALFLIPVVSAQHFEANLLIPSRAGAVREAKLKSVALFDFMGRGQRLDPLGRDLADEFGRALENSGGNFQVIDRSAV
jgi:hypothetical protein